MGAVKRSGSADEVGREHWKALTRAAPVTHETENNRKCLWIETAKPP